MVFCGFETARYVSAIMQEGRFTDAQESLYQAANRSNMVNAVLQCCRLTTSQESLFQAA